MELLGGIRRLLHDDGMTIRGVQKLLREQGVKHVSQLSPSIDSDEMRVEPKSNVVAIPVSALQPETPDDRTEKTEDVPASESIDTSEGDTAEVVTDAQIEHAQDISVQRDEGSTAQEEVHDGHFATEPQKPLADISHIAADPSDSDVPLKTGQTERLRTLRTPRRDLSNATLHRYIERLERVATNMKFASEQPT